MKFEVKHRNAKGGIDYDVVDAESRASVFPIAKEKNWSIISITEFSGKSRSRRAGISQGNAGGISTAVKGVISLVVTLLIGGIVWILVHEEWVEPKESEKPVARAKSEPVTAPVSKARPKPQEKQVEEPVAKPADELPPNKRIVEMISVVTNADGSVLERFRTADGKTRSRQSAPKAVFDNASDQLIAMAITGAASGGSMPPMPVAKNAEYEFAESLKKPIVINPDDTDDIKALKQMVMQTRQEILDRMAEGMSYEDVLREHRDLVNHSVQMRAEATAQIKKYVDAGVFDAAEILHKKANELLAERGIEPIEMPMTREERRQAIREAHGKN